MIDVFDLYQTLQSSVNVEQNGNIRPRDFVNWTNAIQEEIYRDKVKMFPNNQVNVDDLNFLLLQVNLTVTNIQGNAFGLASFPANYQNFASAYTLVQGDGQTFPKEGIDVVDGDGKCSPWEDPDYAAMRAKFAGSNLSEVTVWLIDNMRWGGAMDSVTKGPTMSRPFITQYSEGFKVAPKGVSYVILNYFRPVTACVFNYSIGAGDTIIYDSAGSVQLEWPGNMKDEFLRRLVIKYMGYTRDGEGAQILMQSTKID